MQKRIYKTACQPIDRISKKTLLALIDYSDGTNLLLEKSGIYKTYNRTHNMLKYLRDDQWSITSFSAASRLVCAEIYSDSGTTNYIAFKVPPLI